MIVSSAIVTCEPGQRGAVLDGLACLSATVYGEKDGQLVVVFESAGPEALEALGREVLALPGVAGFHPVFSADD